jgi:hypothetical protein
MFSENYKLLAQGASSGTPSLKPCSYHDKVDLRPNLFKKEILQVELFLSQRFLWMNRLKIIDELKDLNSEMIEMDGTIGHW